jgi:hypothetical protein
MVHFAAPDLIRAFVVLRADWFVTCSGNMTMALNGGQKRAESAVGYSKGG